MFRPTHEQQTILDAAAAGRSLVVNACAGTGKTSTLREIAERTAHPKRLHYLVFNKAAQTDAEKTFPRNTSARTAHSIAYGEVKRSGYAPLLNKLGGNFVPLGTTVRELDITSFRAADTTISPITLAVATIGVIDRFCVTPDHTIGPDLFKPMPNFDAATNARIGEAVINYAQAGWADLLRESGSALRFTHQHYLKLWASGMCGDGSIPRLPRSNDGDLCLYDEAQDANPLMAKVVAAQDHMQRIYVGDEAQAINRFMGAVNAMRLFDADERLPLTQSWRFGPRVADAANIFLSALGSPHAVTGNPDRDTHITTASSADAVLCRTNATVISEVIEAQRAGHTVAVVGGVAEAKRFLDAAEKLKAGLPNTHPELASFPNWDALIEYIGAIDNPGPLGTFVTIVDQYGIPPLRKALADCVEETSTAADVVCSTAHRSKGREWSRVRLSTDFDVDLAETSPTATDESTLERRDDQMLAYVAVTRGMKSVNVGSLYDHEPNKRPASSVDDATHRLLIAKDQVESGTLRATPAELADQFLARVPASLKDDATAVMKSTGASSDKLLYEALKVYVDMHVWGR